MKQETNNEIDLLLRRLGRRQDAPASDTNHLDADELSSYAENALPVAARARYTEHLAECSNCRELVVQLSSAAGVVIAEPSPAAAPSGLTKFLAGLFSPMVLRYAIPAMGLAVVAVIGIGLFLRGERGRNVASLQETQRPVAQQPAPGITFSVESGEKAGTPAATPDARPNQSKENQPSSPNAAAAPVTVAEDVKADPPAEKTKSAEEAPPAPKPTPDEIRPVETEARRQEAQTRPGATTESQGERDRAANQAKAEDKREITTMTTARAAKRAPAPAPAAGAGASTNLQLSDAAKDDDSVESRSVSGRRFRKLRGIWVDTAYKDGATIMDLPRASERYRSIVADEPGIKSIAEQLDGQIIVVWKGSTYRIH